ncbi:MAG: S9 family peptidase [Gammaproteobacteria bacterium]|nr:S9 family peptidase [Gammaproteobacteria bacterium]
MTKPPVAPRIPHTFSHHGITIQDPYHWLKDESYPDVKNPEILAYLEAENAYFHAQMDPNQALVDELFKEIKDRQPVEDASVPYRKGDYWYRWRFEADAQYRQWLRAPHQSDLAAAPIEPASWEVILDEPQLAAQHEYFTLGGISVSPNGRYLAWSADTTGAERFTLNITDLDNDLLLDEPIEQSLGSPVWAADNTHLFYLVVNENWRPYQLRRHTLGEPLTKDRVIYEEPSESFFVGVDKTQSESFILITSGDHVTSEVRYLAANAPAADPILISARREGHQYHVDHREGYFYILTNDTHKNFRLTRTADTAAGEANWETVIAGSDIHYLTGHLCLKDYVVVGERIDGLDQIRIRTHSATGADDEDHFIAFPDAAYSTSLGSNAQYETHTLRLHYQSMVTPRTVYDYDIKARTLVTLKVQDIPTGYDASRYATERMVARSRDGVDVPISVVYLENLPRDGSAPLYLYSYGAYGHATSPGFSTTRLSLLDRGYAFAIAHIRGGDELGYQWYEDGKLDKRTNTFNDFVDCARHLIEEGFSSAGKIVISGGSAGGELMGAVVNQAPEIWGAVAAHVPFVDVLNTMLDASLPLTPIEWPEWGNPIEDKTAFEFIESYSPYDRLAKGAFPPMLVTAGLNDPRVTYWEPAKYVAKLRALKTDDNWLLLKTNMAAGHRGESGRFDALKEVAEEYAFFIVSLERAG